MIDWFGHLYPYTNVHELNLDWVIATVKAGEKEIKNFVGLNTIKYADPILWNITSQYETNTVVVDGQTGNAYISVQPVPVGVALSRTEYWTAIFNYGTVVDTLMSQIASNEGLSQTATKAYNVNDMVFFNSLLYRVIAPMIAGDSFVVDSNVVKTTVSDEIVRILGNDTTLQNNIDNEVTARINADNVLQGNITAVQGNVDSEVTARTNADNLLQSQINAIGNREYILITDSYGDVNNNAFPELFNTLSGNKTTYAAASGQSFQNGGLLTALQNVTVSNPNSITDVVIQGGINDCQSLNRTNTMNGVTNICTYVRSTYPNARVIFAFVGRYLSGATNPDRRYVANLQYVINAIKEACYENKAIYIMNSEFILWDSTLIGSDGLHPTVDGCYVIGRQLYNAMINGFKCSVSAFMNPSGTWTPSTTGDTITQGGEQATGALYSMFVSDALTQFRTPLLSLDIGTAANFTLNDSFYKFIAYLDNSPATMSDAETVNEYKLFETVTNVIFKDTSNNYYSVPLAVGFLGRQLYIRGSQASGTTWTVLSNIDRILIPSTSFTINTLFI